ncbi:hypothetical protein [Roseateles sp.]|uniref:5'-methylthioadenosine/S-adenosylhomocysteine nucleosidase family protein n=1 Tax=Roseateles sp. TaxID=1971397 RepID=UPI003D126577
MRKEAIQVEQIRGSVHAVVITIRPDEYEALEKRLPDPRAVEGGKNSYETALLPNGTFGEIRVALTRCTTQGNLSAQAVANNVIADLDPAWLIITGIAGGVPDAEFSLGDVVLTSALHDFSFGASAQGNVTHETMGGPMHPRVERFLQTKPFGRNGKRLLELAGLVQDGLQSSHPTVPMDHVGLFAATYGSDSHRQKVVASLAARFPEGHRTDGVRLYVGSCANGNLVLKDTELLSKWQESARQVINVETELAGVYAAARSAGRQSYPVLAVRGLSDIVGFKRSAEWTQYACDSAAAVTVAILSAGDIDFREQLPNP